MSFIALVLISTAALASAQNPPSSEDLVQAFSSQGIKPSYTPAGGTTGVHQVNCSQSDFGPGGKHFNCQVFVATSAVPIVVSNSDAERIILDLQFLGVKGVVTNPETELFSVTDLSCVYDALPKPNQTYQPHWVCNI